MPLACCRCSVPVAEPQNSVRFWDGRDFCRSCLEQTLPGLFTYAQENRTLQEDLPDWFNEGLPATVRAALFRISGWWPNRVFPSSWLGRIELKMQQPGLVAALFPPKTIPPVVRSGGSARSVAVTGGIVTLRQGSAILHQARLEDWRWWDGQDLGRSWRKLRLPTYEMLLLIFRNYPCTITAAWTGRPPFGDAFGMAFCGFTPEMRERWRALFVLGGVGKAYGLDF